MLNEKAKKLGDYVISANKKKCLEQKKATIESKMRVLERALENSEEISDLLCISKVKFEELAANAWNKLNTASLTISLEINYLDFKLTLFELEESISE